MTADKDNIVDLIKQKIKITDIAGDYGIDLKERGAYKIAECKFHNSKGKNDFISYDNEGFLCFGCGIKGDIFSLVSWLKHIGANGIEQNIFVGRDWLFRAQKFYQNNFKDNGTIYATFEVIWGKARK